MLLLFISWRFDIEWLRDPRHKSVEYVLQNPSNELSEMQQKCLKGFHNRSARKQLSYAPSSGDIKALSEVYGSEFREYFVSTFCIENLGYIPYSG